MSRVSSLTERTWSWFLHIVPEQQRILSGSLEFDYLSRVVCVKNTWKSSAAAIKEITKGEFFVSYKKQQKIVCVKSSKHAGI